LTGRGLTSAQAARRAARQILDEPRFHNASVPRPLHGLLHAVGRALHAVGQALAFLPRGLDWLVSALAPFVPGGAAVVWSVLAALALAAVVLSTLRTTRRLLSDPARAAAGSRTPPPPSASDLERAAVAAEREGRLGDAVRLRFQSGLLGLGERDVIDFAPSMPNFEVARALRSERFDALARRFDEIVYGGRQAAAEDVETARREWRQLLSAQASR
jgi:Domain of unknown function (DUF4129)